MKKIILMLMFSIAVLSCKNSEEKNKESEEVTVENSENTKIYSGDFINSEDALVLMGPTYIYGVKRDAMAKELTEKVASVKTNDFDMVKVTVRGIVSKNTDGENEWEETLTIKEILMVSDKASEADIKLEETAKKK
ncbi:hypothetical protein [Aequorivita sp. Q41]|uniref:hypothetical protein n=1 Tax=Aequorivita sp. Q41 TaxID=3153300 RepID=UPI00324288AE